MGREKGKKSELCEAGENLLELERTKGGKRRGGSAGRPQPVRIQKMVNNFLPCFRLSMQILSSVVRGKSSGENHMRFASVGVLKVALRASSVPFILKSELFPALCVSVLSFTATICRNSLHPVDPFVIQNK